MIFPDKPRRATVLFMAGLLGLAAPLLAGETELASSLTLDEAVARALQNNPDLRAAQSQWDAAKERPAQERTLPNPMLVLKGQNSPDRFDFPRTQEARVEIEQTFPWFGKLGLRGRVAEKDAELARRSREATALDVTMSVKETYFDLFAVQRSLSITRAEEGVLKRMESIAETRYSTGEASQPDVIKAQAEITMLRQRLLELEEQQATLSARLNQLWDQPAAAPVGLAVTEPAAAVESDPDRLLALAAKSRPEIRNAQAAVDRSEAQRELMRKEFFPDYRIGLEYGHMESGYTDFSSAENVVMLSVGFDLPIWQTKYRAGLREAEKMVQSSQDALEAAKQQTSFDVQDAQFKLQTAQRTVDLYKTALIPQAEARFSSSEAAYRTGKAEFLDLLESERFLLNARVMEAMAEGSLGAQSARLERAVGGPLTEPVSPTEGDVQ